MKRHLRTAITSSVIALALSCSGTCLAKSKTKTPVKPLTSSEQEVLDAYNKLMTDPGQGTFTPPEGWIFADPKVLPSTAKMLVIGKGKKTYPPSINLTSEEFKGGVDDYLKLVKKSSNEQGLRWKSLGKIKTNAGEGSLTQVDSETEWGRVQMMQVILNHDSTIYIMTAAALKEEFPQFYEAFFKAFHSFRINP